MPTPLDPSSAPDARAVAIDVIRRRARGETLSDEEVLAAHPDKVNDLRPLLAHLDLVARAANILAATGSLPIQSGHTEQLRAIGYEIIRPIGVGGQGTTYLVSRMSDDVEFAVKVLHREVRSNDGDWRRLCEEAYLLRSLDHPGIVVCHDAIRTDDGTALLVMDYIPGRPLNAVLESSAMHGLKIDDVRRAIRWISQVCEALHTAHRAGIVHRDVKPHNIRITGESAGSPGVPVLLDFGISDKIADSIPASLSVTRDREFRGSLAYASPEMLDGAEATPSADLWAIGVILHEVVCANRLPFDPAVSLRAFVEHVTYGRRDWRDVPARALVIESPEFAKAVRAVVTKCFAPSAKARYSSAAELADDLNRLLDSKPVLAERPSLSRRTFLIGGFTALAGGGAAAWCFRKMATGGVVWNQAPLTHRLLDGWTFRWCPPGEFMMGLSDADRSDRDAELPDLGQWPARVERGFWIATLETPQHIYQRMTGENPSRFREGHRPVEMLSYLDALRFCKAASNAAQIAIRLPTEVEWEYACRATTTSKWSFGESEANFRRFGNAADLSLQEADITARMNYDDRTPHTAIGVGGFLANAWRLHHMHGNVWEWCQGPYQLDPTDAATVIEDVAPLRGGSYLDTAESCRSGHRNALPYSHRSANVGFRVVAELPDPRA